MEDNSTNEPIILSLKEYNKIQIEWIMVHKWYLSEKCGYDIGFNAAAESWVKSGLAKKFRKKYNILNK